MKKYLQKHPASGKDYQKAFSIVCSLAKGDNILSDFENIKLFRKYIYEIARGVQKSFATRLKGDKVSITRIS